MSRIEMHLEAVRDVAFTSKASFAFRAGETIHTENSHKYGYPRRPPAAPRRRLGGGRGMDRRRTTVRAHPRPGGGAAVRALSRRSRLAPLSADCLPAAPRLKRSQTRGGTNGRGLLTFIYFVLGALILGDHHPGDPELAGRVQRDQHAATISCARS
jgi:hypothetical protein